MTRPETGQQETQDDQYTPIVFSVRTNSFDWPTTARSQHTTTHETNSPLVDTHRRCEATDCKSQEVYATQTKESARFQSDNTTESDRFKEKKRTHRDRDR